MSISKFLKDGKPVKKDGKIKYRVRLHFVDANGNTQQIERIAYGSDEAKQLERELLHEHKNASKAQKLTVSELYNEYIIAKQYEVRESSLTKTKQIITNHVKPYLFNVKIDKLNTSNLQQWKQKIEAKSLSITMRKNIYSEFRALLNFAVKMEYLPKNPLLKVGNFKAPLENHKEMLYYTVDEFKKYIATARKRAEETDNLVAWNYYVFFNIAFFTGCRKGEIYALTWQDIKEHTIYITKSLNQTLKGADRITPPKNRTSIRNIQIPEPLQNVLDEHYKRCQVIVGFKNTYYICGGTIPLRDTSVDTANQQFANAAGIKRIRIHDFRHPYVKSTTKKYLFFLVPKIQLSC